MEEDGIVAADLEKALSQDDFRLFYTVPNFQNPHGITHSREKLRMVSDIISGSDTVLVEDDPYGEAKGGTQAALLPLWKGRPEEYAPPGLRKATSEGMCSSFILTIKSLWALLCCPDPGDMLIQIVLR